jgi:hypothetical protein
VPAQAAAERLMVEALAVAMPESGRRPMDMSMWSVTRIPARRCARCGANGGADATLES